MEEVNKPLVSVIMGVYNSKSCKLLKKSIDSILNQSYSNIEFIICDDCSTNINIKKILEEYRQIDKRVKIITNGRNSGLAFSLNNCLKNASGEYIARQDDDDISHLTRLEKEIDYLNKNPGIDFVGCTINLYNKNGVWGIRRVNKNPTKEDLIKGSQFAHPSLLFRKKVFDIVEGYRVEKITRRVEDYDLYMRIYGLGLKGGNLQEIYYDYYEGDETYKNQRIKYKIDELKVRKRGYKEMGISSLKSKVYIIKPLMSAIIPRMIRKRINKKNAKGNKTSNIARDLNF